jgi:hypothetical protein
MDFFSLWWIPFVVAGGLGLGGLGMWLEHKRKQKALDVLKEALSSGREVPEPLVQALTRGNEDEWGMGGSGMPSTRSGWTGVAFFVILSAGFAIAAWFSDGRATNAFWLVAGIMAAMAVMTAVSHLTRTKS